MSKGLSGMAVVTEDEEHVVVYMRTAPMAHVFEHWVPHWRKCLGRIGSLVGESVSLGWALRFQKTQAIPSALSLPHDCGSRCEPSAAGATTPLLCCHGP